MTDESFRVAVQENGTVRAGGLTLGRVRGGCLVVPDRYRDRCIARGTDDVPVDLIEFMEVIIQWIERLDR